jgi:hypothetical protein
MFYEEDSIAESVREMHKKGADRRIYNLSL